MYCIVLSRDAECNSGKKKIAYFPQPHQMVDFLERNVIKSPRQSRQSHYYVIIVDSSKYSVFMFFDIDKYLTENINPNQGDIEDVVHTFLNVLTRFLKIVYLIDFDPVVGKTVQVTTSCSPSSHKLSLHVKTNIVCANMNVLKHISTQLYAFVLSNSYCNEDERVILTFLENKRNTPYTESIFDTSVYTNFRSIRVIYSSKWKGDNKGIALQPYGCSSSRVLDHLINVYEINQDQAVQYIHQSNNFQIQVDYSKSAEINVKNTPFISKVLDCESNTHVPDIPLSHVNKVKNALAKSNAIKQLFKTNNFKCIDDSRQEHTNTYNYYFKGYHCPYANRTHCNNRSYLYYNYNKRCVVYRCLIMNVEIMKNQKVV